MRSVLFFAGFVLALTAGTARAQSASIRRKTSAAEVATRTFDSLFVGIALDSMQAEIARSRVRRCLDDQYNANAFQPDFRDRVLALAETRNADLLALLRSAVDSARFSANAARVDARLRAPRSGSR